MATVQEYLDYTQKWLREYGPKTLVLMQVGSFFESYSLRKADGTIYGIDSPYGSNIEEFASINDMTIANKASFLDQKQVVMAGVGVAYIEKYLKKMQEHDYTVVLYKQDNNAKNTTRSLSEIISPGTFFSSESEELSNNVMCIWLHKSNANKYTGCQVTLGVANIDIFTGKTALFQFSAEYNHNPATYDELERYIAAFNPSECLIVANMPEKILNDIIGFVGLQSSKIHKVDIRANGVGANGVGANGVGANGVGANGVGANGVVGPNMLFFAQNAEKQIYQKEILKRFYPHIMDPEFFQASPTHFVAKQAFCFLLDFVNQHSPNLVKKLAEPVFENYTDKLVLANHSLYQLNMIDDARHTGKLRSVSSLLNNCVTTMGKRQFLYNLHNPITNKTLLDASYAIIEHLLATPVPVWQTLRSQLTGIKDIEKLQRKLVLQKVAPKDFALLARDLQIISTVYDNTIKDAKLTEYIKNAYTQLTTEVNVNEINVNEINVNEVNVKQLCQTLLTDLNKVLDLEKCQTITEISGDVEVFIQPGICPTIDTLVKDSLDGREKLEAIRSYFSDVIKSVEKTSKDTHYIKIHETPKNDAVLMGTSRRVEILKAFLKRQQGQGQGQLDGNSVRMHYKSNYSKQDEVFVFDLTALDFQSVGTNKKDLIITSTQIRQITAALQTSREKIVKELQWAFTGYLNDFTQFEPALQTIVQYTANVDLVQCKCYMAHKYNYCKPVIEPQEKAFLTFTGIRHPLIEHLQTNELYVTNDLSLNKNVTQDPLGVLLYGTNAVGKTSFIKSIGIALIMAQAGLYVPCQSFIYSPYNYIFTRILGNDNLFKGLSTFAVEMSELRTILKMADASSLVLGDELCSGTESDSALSIFTAGLEILHAKHCTFLFATHFHEINTYDEIKALTRLKMLHMAVTYDRERGLLVYDRKLRDGPGESMYGLEVCKSLHLPDDFLQRAHDIRMKYNAKDKNILALGTSHFNAQKIVGVCELCEKEPASEVHHLQHQEGASKVNAYIKSFHKNHVANLLNICETCHKGIHKTGQQHKVKKTTKKYELTAVV